MRAITFVMFAFLIGCTADESSSAPPTQHLITYGQSLSLGARAVVNYPTDLTIPATDDEDVGLMFAGGTRPTDLSSLVPFAESTAPVDINIWNITQPGETPLYGAMLTLKGMPGVRIGSAAGRGGTPIAGLSKGTDPYARLIAQVATAKTLAPGPYSVLGIIWLQGESDIGNTNYASEFEQLIMDVDADIKAITTQPAVQWYVCVTAIPEIAAQQRAVAAAMPQVHIVCDCATLAHSDGQHLTAASSKEVGIAVGNAILTP